MRDDIAISEGPLRVNEYINLSNGGVTTGLQRSC
jgi:hypothetical protein